MCLLSFLHLGIEKDKGQKKEDLHLPTLIKQAAYMILMFLINIGFVSFYFGNRSTFVIYFITVSLL